MRPGPERLRECREFSAQAPPSTEGQAHRPTRRAVPTGNAYRNRYISVLSITDRKIAHWRDYLDPLAVFDAVGWPTAAARGLAPDISAPPI